VSRRISFKLYKQELELALAFERHCRVNLNITRPLDDLIKQQFLKFLLYNIDRDTQNEDTNADDTPGTAGVSPGEGT